MRSSRRRCSVRKGVLWNLAKFTGKHLCQSLFFNKVKPATLLKKRLWYKCFPVNFAKFLRTYFSQNTSGRLLLKIKLLFIHNSEKTTPIYFQIVWYEIPEAVVPRYSVKKVFLKISQNSQENPCAKVSFLIKLQGSAWAQLY